MGFRIQAEPRWSYWPRTGVRLGLAVLGASLVVALGLWLVGSLPPLRSGFANAGEALPFLWQGCLWAPIEEELLYRAALCAPLAVWLGPRITVLLGGLAFAVLHLAYGNLGPNHLFAGFVLTWAYLRSGNLLVPIALHAAGNVLVLLLNLILLAVA